MYHSSGVKVRPPEKRLSPFLLCESSVLDTLSFGMQDFLLSGCLAHRSLLLFGNSAASLPLCDALQYGVSCFAHCCVCRVAQAQATAERVAELEAAILSAEQAGLTLKLALEEKDREVETLRQETTSRLREVEARHDAQLEEVRAQSSGEQV